MSPWLALVHVAWLPALWFGFAKLYEGRWPLLSALAGHFAGGVAVLPALLLELALDTVLPPSDGLNLLSLVVSVAPAEEGAKLLAALAIARLLGVMPPQRSFLLIAAATALGFGSVESVLAAMQAGPDILPARLFVSIPGHALFTLAGALWLIGAKAPHTPPAWAFAAALLSAMTVHVAYDAALWLDADAPLGTALIWLVPITVAVAVLAWRRGWRQR